MMNCLGYTSLLFAGVIFHIIPGHLSQTATYANETALRATLQSGYDRFSRPYSPTVVNFTYNIRTLMTLDITAQTMDHLGWFVMLWTDPRISWDPAAYNNLTYLYVNWAWRPEISIPNGHNMAFGLDDDETRLTVFSDGSVMWTPVMAGQTTCDVNVANFPFDKQSCIFDVMFWGMESNRDVTINILSPTIGTSQYLVNGEWDIGYTNIYKNLFSSCCPATTQTFVSIQMDFARLHPYFVINLIMPAILLSICMTWSFYLPTESGERLGYCLTILLSYTVLLTITSSMVPTTSTEISYLGMYLLMILVFCTLAVCNVAINVKLFTLEDQPSHWFKVFYRKLHPMMFCTGCHKKRKNKVEAMTSHNATQDMSIIVEDVDYKKCMPADDVDTGPEVEQDEPPVTWPMISILLDRICFWVYNFVIAVSNIAVIILLTTSDGS